MAENTVAMLFLHTFAKKITISHRLQLAIHRTLTSSSVERKNCNSRLRRFDFLFGSSCNLIQMLKDGVHLSTRQQLHFDTTKPFYTNKSVHFDLKCYTHTHTQKNNYLCFIVINLEKKERFKKTIEIRVPNFKSDTFFTFVFFLQ